MLLDFEALIKKHELDLTGVYHVGAHWGQESSTYEQMGLKNVVYFEPQRAAYERLMQTVKYPADKNVILVKVALGDTDDEMEMFTETVNQGQSSSLLRPVLHLQMYPRITFPARERVPVRRLDGLVEKYEFTGISRSFARPNCLVMDVQGYELHVLRGAQKTLEAIECVYSEVNNAELYEGCARVEQLDEFLANYDMTRVETSWTPKGWGDALYVRRASQVPQVLS